MTRFGFCATYPSAVTQTKAAVFRQHFAPKTHHPAENGAQGNK